MLTRCQRDNPQPEHRTRTWLRLRNASTPLGTGWPEHAAPAPSDSSIAFDAETFIHHDGVGLPGSFATACRMRWFGCVCAALSRLRSSRLVCDGRGSHVSRSAVREAVRLRAAEHFTETIKMRFQRVSQIEVRWFHGGRTCRRSTTSGPDGSPPRSRRRPVRCRVRRSWRAATSATGPTTSTCTWPHVSGPSLQCRRCSRRRRRAR